MFLNAGNAKLKNMRIILGYIATIFMGIAVLVRYISVFYRYRKDINKEKKKKRI